MRFGKLMSKGVISFPFSVRLRHGGASLFSVLSLVYSVVACEKYLFAFKSILVP